MATAAELLANAAETTEKTFVADLNTRTITVPPSEKILGVESDDDVKRLQFSIPRHYGDIDLSEFDIRINYKNARNAGDVYPVENAEVTEDSINFSWLVDRSAFNYAGKVTFNICLKKLDSTGMVVKELNTTVASLDVLEGLETEKAVVDNNPSAFDAVLFRLYAVEAATGLSQGGYYTVVKVTDSADGAVFTVIDQNGITEAVIRNGRDGKDGYTPVKGKDYWTDEDEAEIENDIANITREHVLNWAPGFVTVTLSVDNWVEAGPNPDTGLSYSDIHQFVEVEGVTEDNVVVIAPSPHKTQSYDEYSFRKVRCTAQTTNKLTFIARSRPTVDIYVNVAVYYAFDSMPGVGSSMIVTDDGDGNVVIT